MRRSAPEDLAQVRVGMTISMTALFSGVRYGTQWTPEKYKVFIVFRKVG